MNDSIVFMASDFNDYANYLIKDYNDRSHGLRNNYDIKFEYGIKYIRVVHVDGSGNRSAHSFIEKSTGNILKCNSWKSPAKNFPRGNVLTKDFSRCKWTGCG